MQGRDGSLSFQTLIIASVSSAAAALLTSLFWESGTVFSAAFTPVIVSIVSEALRKPATTISQVRTVRRAQTMGGDSTAGSDGATGENGSSGPTRGRPGGGTATAERPTVTASVGGEGPTGGPRGTRFGRRRMNMRLALVTGGLAFLIAAAFLTLPELIAGQSVAGQPGRTTLGGGSSVDTSGEDTEVAPAQEGEGTGEEPASGDPEAESAPSEKAAPEAGAAGAEDESPSDQPASPEPPQQQQRGAPEGGGSTAPGQPGASQPAEPQQP